METNTKLGSYTTEKPKHEEKESVIDFSWIEKGFKGQLVDTDLPVGTSKEELLAQKGEPLDTGWYEGGLFYQYEEETYFIHPDREVVVAIAKPISKLELNVQDVKKALGNPDIDELNEMEGLWMIEYKIGNYRLMFEAEEQDGAVIYVWLFEQI